MSTSRPITNEEHEMIMRTMSENHIGIRANPDVIHILTIECSTGLRLSDILAMKLSDFYLTDNGYRLKIREQKTKKERNVPYAMQKYPLYCVNIFLSIYARRGFCFEKH